MTAIALTIAGSDSSGSAGIQADLKTFAALAVYGASAITALTAQNTQGVEAVLVVPPDFVARQIKVVARDLKVDAIKIGMLAEAHLTAVVYDPPVSGLPHVAVLFDAEGDVIAVRTAASIEEGEAALATLIADISAAQHATA